MAHMLTENEVYDLYYSPERGESEADFNTRLLADTLEVSVAECELLLAEEAARIEANGLDLRGYLRVPRRGATVRLSRDLRREVYAIVRG